jgi:elongator complex protein 1
VISIDFRIARRSSQATEKIAQLCDAIRVELERRDLRRYIQSILTAHVVKTPPDYEAGLLVLHRLRGRIVGCD